MLHTASPSREPHEHDSPGQCAGLTSLSHGGGCGCKLAPAVLTELLRSSPSAASFASLLVGRETADDAAVYQLNNSQALVATTDFFMPIVAGGHSIDSVEPIYGLVALGVVHPRNVKRNCDARAGDALILGKPLGVGIFSAALKKQQLTGDDYRSLIETTTRLNRAGPALGELASVHAMTDVTGFGLLGHLLEMCRGARLGARVHMSGVPVLKDVLSRAAAGQVTGASARNWSSYGDEVRLAPQLAAAHQALLCDPQTSGGLLVACAPEGVPEALAVFERQDLPHAAVVGEFTEGTPVVHVEP